MKTTRTGSAGQLADAERMTSHAALPTGRRAIELVARAAIAPAIIFCLVASASAGPPPDAAWVTAAGHPAEDKIDALLGEPRLEMRQVFQGERFPNIVVAVDGTVLATWGSSSVRVRRSEDGGKSWGEEITIAKPGFQGGGLTVDEKRGDILAFVEANHPPAPVSVYRSANHGKTWQVQEVTIEEDCKGNVPSMHMNEHGITLRHGEHKGRLLRPSRWYAGENDRARWPQHYTSAVYSDDGGRTWKTSDPFPAFGTGEATLAELADGRIYYNSRRHWAPEGENPRRRWTAWSEDGGATWKDLSICEVLPDGPQDTNYGCMAGLVRLPVRGRDILLYSNCDSPAGRHHGTVWASFDGGKTWPWKRLVYEGSFAYSSLTAGRPHTKSEGWIFLHFEGGPQGGSTVARFNLSWLLAGNATGEGTLPKWLDQND
jgi:sialidase-1